MSGLDSLIREITADIVAAEVVLLRGSMIGPILIVEGPSDEAALSRALGGDFGFVISHGKDRGDAAVAKLNASNRVRGFVFIRDRDFDYLEATCSTPNVILTENYDLLVDVVAAGGLKRMMVALLGTSGATSLESRTAKPLQTLAVRAASLVGRYRYAAFRAEVVIDLDTLEFDFITKGQLTGDATSLANKMTNRLGSNAAERSKILSELTVVEGMNLEDIVIVRGHDLAKCVARVLRIVSNSKNVRNLDGSMVEAFWRLALDSELLKSTCLYGRLREWMSRSGYSVPA